MNTWIGTSGFQYPEWKGKFYPERMPPTKMLPYYAERFGSTEVNYSFRTIPSEKTIGNWNAATPAGFRFSFKAPQRVTHFAKLRNCTATVEELRMAIASLGDKLGPILFQLPPTFVKDVGVLRAFLEEMPRGIRAAFEFRHESWMAGEVFDALRQSGAALCIAESEEFVTPSEVTASFGYLRLRREDYTSAELAKWAKFTAKQTQWSDAFVYFKHEERAVGVAFAREFAEKVSATKRA